MGGAIFVDGKQTRPEVGAIIVNYVGTVGSGAGVGAGIGVVGVVCWCFLCMKLDVSLRLLKTQLFEGLFFHMTQ